MSLTQTASHRSNFFLYFDLQLRIIPLPRKYFFLNTFVVFNTYFTVTVFTLINCLFRQWKTFLCVILFFFCWILVGQSVNIFFCLSNCKLVCSFIFLICQFFFGEKKIMQFSFLTETWIDHRYLFLVNQFSKEL